MSGPTTAASTGPASAACAVASSQPATLGARAASGGSSERMLPARARCSWEPESAEQDSSAPAKAAAPLGVAPSNSSSGARPPWALETWSDSPAASLSVPSVVNRAQAAARMPSASRYQRVRPVTA